MGTGVRIVSTAAVSPGAALSRQTKPVEKPGRKNPISAAVDSFERSGRSAPSLVVMTGAYLVAGLAVDATAHTYPAGTVVMTLFGLLLGSMKA